MPRSAKTATAVAAPIAIGNHAPLSKPNTQPHAATAPSTAARMALLRHQLSHLILRIGPPGLGMTNNYIVARWVGPTAVLPGR